VRGGRCRRLSVTSTTAAAMMVGGIFVCSGTALPYSLLAERQPALHSRLRLLWFRPGNRHRATRASSADSESPLATGITSGRGMVLVTSLDFRCL